MKKYLGVLYLLALALTPLTIRAQAPKPLPVPTPPDAVAPVDDSVVRVTTNLIQIDAVVTDSRGNLITDLKPEDFEIIVNGKPQPITAFSLVTLDAQPQAAERSTAVDKETRGNIAPAPSVKLRPTQVKRTIALIVDDLNIDRRNIVHVRSALKKFADEQMQPGDLVAVIRVGSSIGVLQAFTSDKRQIYAAIERIRYNLAQGRWSTEIQSKEDISVYYPFLRKEDAGVQGNESVRQMLEIGLASPGLTATNAVIQGMRDLPGRKAVLLLSDGFSISLQGIRSSVNRVVDTANRSGVVVYTMDTRGLVSEGLTAADIVTTGMTSRQISSAMFGASNAFSASQEGMMYLAEQAGGFAIYNTNDISGGIRRVLDDQNSYYLIGYQPDASLFDPAALRFNQLKIKVKRPGLRVRYRSGFFGIKDEKRTVGVSPKQKILQALISPFASDDISLRLTPLIANDAKAGSLIRTLVHVPAKGLVFADKPGNFHEAVINIVAYTFGLNGVVVDSVGETHTLTLSDKLYERAQSSGFVYSLNLPIKKPGPYQLRVAVRDDKSDKVGTASQFIVVPDINKNRLTLSGIALNSYNAQDETDKADNVEKQSPEDAAGKATLTQATERRFRAGSVLQFGYSIYNAKTKSGLPPSLTTQIKLYRDGKEIFVGKETPYDAGVQTDLKRLLAGGSLQLGSLDEGEYVLQTIVTDANANEKHRTTMGWIDFEIVK